MDFGLPNLLVNKVKAIIPKGNVADLDIDVCNRAIELYLTGLFLVSRSVTPLMQSGGGGAIVNIASTLANVAARKAFAYFASEGGLLQTKSAVKLDHAKDCARIKVVS